MESTRRQPRLKDLSQALGLSITTVSRALAGYDDVSPSTQERVRSKARELGYVPSRAGRMLVSGATNAVSLVIPARDPTFIDPFLGAFITGLGEGLARSERDLFIATVSRGQDEIEVIRHIVQGGRADGIVLTRTQLEDPRVGFLIEQGFPFVSHGRSPGEKRPHLWYDSDGERAFAEAAQLLIGLGHRRFGFLTIEEPFSFAHYRRRGLEQALEGAGLALPPDRVVTTPRGDADALRAACHRILTVEPRPTAVLCVVDELALRLLETAAELGIALPEQLSVVGFDNLPVAAYAKPGLSTFDHDPKAGGERVAEMLAPQLGAPAEAPAPILAPARFVPRGSHGAAPHQDR